MFHILIFPINHLVGVWLQLYTTFVSNYVHELPSLRTDRQIQTDPEAFHQITDWQYGILPYFEIVLDIIYLFCCSGKLSLIRQSLYVGVVEKPPPPPLTGEQYGKMEPEYPEDGHCQSILPCQGVLASPYIFL